MHDYRECTVPFVQDRWLIEKVTSVDKTLEKVVDRVDQARLEMTGMQVKLDILWRHDMSQSNSPVTLNEFGVKALTNSKIGNFANERYYEILGKVKSLLPENAYQAQELLISVVGLYKNEHDCRLKLQEAAFSSGCDVDSLLFVAALAIRDRVISDLGF